MIVKDAEVRLYAIPPAARWEDATCKVPRLEFLTVELTTDTEIVGTGLTYTVGVGGSAIKALLEDYCVSLVKGLDALCSERAWTLLWEHLHRTGSGGLNTLAIAGVDTAIWDIVAKTRHLPLYQALGGSHRALPAYASGIDLHLEPDELRGNLQMYVDQGYRGTKIKVGCPTIDQDVARVATARETLGGDHLLLLDANQGWDLQEAQRRLKAFEEFRPYWIEEPLIAEDIEGHARLRRVTDVPIAVGESLYTSYQFLAYLRAEAADIFQPDVARVGGITPWLKIAHLCEAWNRPVCAHYLRELSAHLHCAVPNSLIIEEVLGGSLTDMGLLRRPMPISNGLAEPSILPGHGIDFDFRRMKEHEVTAA